MADGELQQARTTMRGANALPRPTDLRKAPRLVPAEVHHTAPVVSDMERGLIVAEPSSQARPATPAATRREISPEPPLARGPVIELDPILIEGRVPRAEVPAEVPPTTGLARQRATDNRATDERGARPYPRALLRAIRGRENTSLDSEAGVVEAALEEWLREHRGDDNESIVQTFLREQEERRTGRISHFRRRPKVPDAVRRTPILGNIVGILVGLGRNLERLGGVITALPELPGALLTLLETLTSSRFLRDNDLQRELLGELILGPLREIEEDFTAAMRAAEDGDQVESSAKLIEATGRLLELMTGLASAHAFIRRLPGSAARLRSAAQRLRTAAQRIRGWRPSRSPRAPRAEGIPRPRALATGAKLRRLEAAARRYLANQIELMPRIIRFENQRDYGNAVANLRRRAAATFHNLFASDLPEFAALPRVLRNALADEYRVAMRELGIEIDLSRYPRRLQVVSADPTHSPRPHFIYNSEE